MFKRSVSSTPLTNDAANLFFRNITGEAYGSDHSFLASLRALVAPRLPEGESVNVFFGKSDFNAAIISETPARRMVEMICSGMYRDNGQIYIHNLANRDEANNIANIELLKSKFTEVYPGWQQLERVSEFYHKSFKCLCFINPETKSATVFVEQLNLQKLHYLQISILAFLPWYFNPETGLTADEFALVESLRKKDSAEYEAALKKLATLYDFESARIKQLLSGFEIRFEQRECDRVQNNINNIDRDIESLGRQFADLNRRRSDECIRLLGLKQKIAEGDGSSEIMDYFLCNRKLQLVRVDGTKILFVVRDYLMYFDEDMARRYINNRNSYIYYYCSTRSGKITPDQMKKLMWAIFVDQTLKMRWCAAYEFQLDGRVVAQRNYSFGPECDDYMPNPHIYYHQCMGNYEGKVNKLLAHNDYITAIEQCVASAKSFNFGDSTVGDKFVSVITGDRSLNNKCIELPDGKVVNPKEAIKWLEEQEAAKAAAKAEAEAAKAAEATATRATSVPDDVAARMEAEAVAPAATPAAQEQTTAQPDEMNLPF